jgi:hypothetical protein
MADTLDPLILDLVEWCSKEPRTYFEVIDAWRTSCPRLTVWKEAIERGYLKRVPANGTQAGIAVTPKGRVFLASKSG